MATTATTAGEAAAAMHGRGPQIGVGLAAEDSGKLRPRPPPELARRRRSYSAGVHARRAARLACEGAI
jgi:hypothetical protein